MSHASPQLGPTPPDGGWGWVVVFASFMIHIVTDGVTYSFGVIHVELVRYFQEGDAATAWIASILVGTTLCSGPISSAFVNKYGCRPVTIAGAVLASSSLAVSMFAPNVFCLYITVGIGTGLGFGLIYLPAIVSVTCYFEKYRSLATGIAVCGSGLGTFISAPFIEFLVTEYGWRGAMLIIAALVLNCIIFGILFRPLEDSTPEPRLVLDPSSETMKRHIEMNGDSKIHMQEKKHDSLPTRNGISRPHSVHGHCTILAKHINGTTLNRDAKSKDINRLALSQPMLVTSSTAGQESNTRPRQHFGSQNLPPGHSGIMYRKDVLYRGSLANIVPHNRSAVLIPMEIKTGEGTSLMRPPSPDSVALSLAEDETAVVCWCIPCPRETKDTLTEMLDFSLFKDPIFILFTVSNFLTSIGFNIPYVYLAAQGKKRNLTIQEGSWLLAIIGMSNMIGRIILGYLSDKPWVNRLMVYNCCLTLCGISTVLSAFCFNFITFAMYSAVFGFTIGAYVGLTSVILVDLLGLNKLTNAFGLLLLFQGIASFLGPPFAGWLSDITASYNPGFYVSGITIALSGIILFIIPSAQRYFAAKELGKVRKNRETFIDGS